MEIENGKVKNPLMADWRKLTMRSGVMAKGKEILVIEKRRGKKEGKE